MKAKRPAFLIEPKGKDTDEKVQEMIESWSIVPCRICGKNISMLTANFVRNGLDEFFACKEHFNANDK